MSVPEQRVLSVNELIVRLAPTIALQSLNAYFMLYNLGAHHYGMAIMTGLLTLSATTILYQLINKWRTP